MYGHDWNPDSKIAAKWKYYEDILWKKFLVKNVLLNYFNESQNEVYQHELYAFYIVACGNIKLRFSIFHTSLKESMKSLSDLPIKNIKSG